MLPGDWCRVRATEAKSLAEPDQKVSAIYWPLFTALRRQASTLSRTMVSAPRPTEPKGGSHSSGHSRIPLSAVGLESCPDAGRHRALLRLGRAGGGLIDSPTPLGRAAMSATAHHLKAAAVGLQFMDRRSRLLGFRGECRPAA